MVISVIGRKKPCYSGRAPACISVLTGGEMKKIRVLLVADSAVMRKVLGTLIASDSHSEVVGTGANGRVALEQLELLQPVREIRERGSQVPIIMCSSLTATGARRTLDSLPSAVLSVEETAPEIVKRGVSTRDARSTLERRI